MKFNELKVGQKFKISGDKESVYLKGLLHSTGKPKAISLNNGHIYDINNQNIIPINDNKRVNDNKHVQERTKIIISDCAGYQDDSYLSVTEEQMRLLEYLQDNGFITLKGSADVFVEV